MGGGARQETQGLSQGAVCFRRLCRPLPAPRTRTQPVFIQLPLLLTVPIIKTEPTDDYEPALTCGPASQGLGPLPKPCYGQQLAMPPDPGACLAAGFPPCPPRSSVMPPPPSASPKLHDLSPAPYGKGMASPGHDPLRLQRPAGGAFVGQEAPRPVGVHPGSPQQPQVSPQLSSSCSPGHQPALCANSPSSPLLPGAQEPTCLQPRSPARPPGMGHLQHQLPKVPEKASAATRPLPLPEVREDSNHSLAPTPVSVKREPQDLDQLYLDDGKCPRPGGRAGWRRAERAVFHTK